MNNGNLILWKKGQSGNPAGKKKGTKDGLRARAIRWLKADADVRIIEQLESIGVKFENNDNADLVMYQLGSDCLKGDLVAIKMLFDQTETPLSKLIEEPEKPPAHFKSKEELKELSNKLFSDEP